MCSLLRVFANSWNCLESFGNIDVFTASFVCKLLELFGILWNPLESFGFRWIPLESVGIRWNPLDPLAKRGAIICKLCVSMWVRLLIDSMDILRDHVRELPHFRRIEASDFDFPAAVARSIQHKLYGNRNIFRSSMKSFRVSKTKAYYYLKKI